jgi:hypothetical protein
MHHSPDIQGSQRMLHRDTHSPQKYASGADVGSETPEDSETLSQLEPSKESKGMPSRTSSATAPLYVAASAIKANANMVGLNMVDRLILMDILWVLQGMGAASVEVLVPLVR